MGVVGVEFADYFIYTAKGTYFERILFDGVCYKQISDSAKAFWVKYVAPELLYGTLEKNMNHQLSDDHIYGQTLNAGTSKIVDVCETNSSW